MKPAKLRSAVMGLTLVWSSLLAQIPTTPVPTRAVAEPTPPKTHKGGQVQGGIVLKPLAVSDLHSEYRAGIPPKEFYKRLNESLAPYLSPPKHKPTQSEKAWGLVGRSAGLACAGIAGYQAVQAVVDKKRRRRSKRTGRLGGESLSLRLPPGPCAG